MERRKYKTEGLRAPFHDYKAPSVYLVTLHRADAFDLCVIRPGEMETREVGGQTLQFPKPMTTFLPNGLIVRDSVSKFRRNFKEVIVSIYSIMPDHVHLLIRVPKRIPRALSDYVARFKAYCTAGLRAKDPTAGEFFSPGFHDTIARTESHLITIQKYIHDNPRRYLIKKLNPEFFQRVFSIEIGGRQYSLFGNSELLQNPTKAQVKVSHTFDDAKFTALIDFWRRTVVNGGVLVSPFVSEREKEFRDNTLEYGGAVIQILSDGFPERFKPPGRMFDYCMNGQLLYVAPTEFKGKRGVSRAECLEMNALAAVIAGADPL